LTEGHRGYRTLWPFCLELISIRFSARDCLLLGDRGIAAPFYFKSILDKHYTMPYHIIMSKYRKNAGAVFSLKYHIVWCPKYRRKVLSQQIASRLKELLYQKATELDMEIHALEIMPDHVHLFVESDPTWAIAGIANALKGYTSRILRQEFASLKSRLPTLWSRSYYAGTVGHVSEKTVRKYIESQKGK